MKGTTLLELLVSLVLSGMIAAIALPSLQESLIRLRLKSTAEKTASLIRQAKLECQHRRQGGRVLISQPMNAVLLFFDEENVWNYSIKEPFEVSSNRSEIFISADGIVTPTTVVVSRRNRRCQISISLRGRVRVRCLTSG